MNSNAPKISFIPKSSMSRGGDDFGRPRPKSIAAISSIIIFFVIGGVFAGLSYYKSLLDDDIANKITAIKDAQAKINQSPAIKQAKEFNQRAALTKQLLDSHIVITPVFDFLNQNAVSSIKYDSFTFKQEDKAEYVEIKGEAPSYASLVNQLDVVKSKNKELASYSVKDVLLTEFGSVKFTLKVTFIPGYLSYTNTQRVTTTQTLVSPTATVQVPPMANESAKVSTPGLTPLPPYEAQSGTAGATSATSVGQISNTTTGDISAQTAPVVAPETQTEKSVWSWLKFW